ncbi:pyridoxal phosphate-dependent aminotransferase [Lentzea jiangxiensis]|uniref:pyridoxal phosphate-dependent aminotransferase n=1 Tax=Lentzea jiangxiensis TaxID=641025 RepID=UPI001C40ADF1|nr:pyridoxal phosphate-dependent aminotransferase [Lentzea jiangxiensis]
MFRAVDAYDAHQKSPAIRLHVGEPAFRPPPSVAIAIATAAAAGRTGYTTAEGLGELRTALVRKLREHNGHDTDVDRVFVTPGSTQGLQAIMQSLAAPGTEILLPALHWPIYLQQALLAGLLPATYPLDDHLRPDLAALAGLPAGPKILVVNSPNNPSGAICDRRLLSELLELAHRRGWWIISDEAYEHFNYDGEVLSLAALEAERDVGERRVFSAFTFSKSYGMTGWRLGYVTAPTPRQASLLQVVQEATIVCPPQPIQLAGVAALADDDAISRNSSFVRANRDLMARALRGTGLMATVPEGGWYALLDCAATGLDADTFAARLLAEEGVALASATGFALRPPFSADSDLNAIDPSARHLLRLAFCGDRNALLEGLARLVRFTRRQCR